MKTCPYCYKDLPDDAQFCTYCGKSLDGTQRKKKDVQKKLKVNSRKNNWAVLGLFLLIIGLIGCDFLLSILLSAFIGNEVFPFYLSFLLYMMSIICGFLSLYIDRKDKKLGYQPSGNKSYAYVCICVSLFIALTNLSQVILK